MKIPFRGGPDHTKVKTPDDRMTLTEHLAELRTRIIRSMLAIVLGVIVLQVFYDPLLRFLRKPYTDLCERKPELGCVGSLQFLSPLEGFSTRLTITTYGGIILAMPVLMWQLWRFIVPALHAKEKKYAIPFVLSSIALFALGGFVAYWTLGPALDFLISCAGEEQVHQPGRPDGGGVRHRLRVPGAAGVPPTGRGPHAANAAQAVALRDRRHLRHRGRHHPQR